MRFSEILTGSQPHRISRRTALGALGVAAASACLPGLGRGDEPALPEPGPASWTSFRNGPQQLGVAGSTLPDKLRLQWKADDPEGFASTAAIVGDRVYVGTISGHLWCLDLETGKNVWTYRSVADAAEGTFLPAFKSSPAVTADAVYLGDEDGVFHAIDRRTGKARWTYKTEAEIVSSANVFDDRVLFGSHDNSLYCLKQATGELAWKFETDNMVNCAPAISGRYTFIAGCDEHLRIVNIDTGQQETDIPLESYLIASPAVVGEMLYVGTYAAEVVAVNWQTQEFVWRYRDPVREFPFHSSAAVTDSLVVVGGRDKLVHAIHRDSGERAWVFRTGNRVDSSPAIVGDRVFIGSGDGRLYELGLSDGKERWRHVFGRPVNAGPAIGGNRLIVGAEGTNGSLCCFGE